MGDDKKRCMYGEIDYGDFIWSNLLIYYNVAKAIEKWGAMR